MKTTILIYCSLVCMAAGQWSTNIWPSYAYPRQSAAQFAEVHSAAVERCYAAGLSIAGLRLYRSQYANLTNIKARIREAVPYYIVTNGQDGDLSAEIETNGLRHYTSTSILASVKMPTNFFDYTPWSNLSGVGPFTNAGLAWGNGWTNAQTEAGGTNYPEGRTKWFTTDYGLMRITNVFPALLWANANLGGVTRYQLAEYKTVSTNATPQDVFDLALADSNGWPFAYYTATNGDPQGGEFLIGQSSAMWWYDDQSISLWITTGEADIYPDSTNRPPIEFDVDLYAKCGPYEYQSDAFSSVPFEDRTFDNFGDVRYSETWQRIAQETGKAATNFIYKFGSTNFPPILCDAPAITNSATLRGRALSYIMAVELLNDKFISILKFDGTNGFRYR
jgi:hypothetical protein